MPATLTSIAPASGNPGDQITLTGTGFARRSCRDVYTGAGQAQTDSCAIVVGAAEITSTVPDFGGDAVALAITVTSGDDPVTAPVAFGLNQWPPVDAIYPLCGLNAVRRELGLEPTERDLDATLRRLIETASAQMAGLITYDMKPITLVNEAYDGTGMDSLELRHSPIVSISALTIDTQTIDVSEISVYPDYIAFQYADGTDWMPRLRSGCRLFSYGRQNVLVSYVAGYVNVPSDLSVACVHQVIFLRNTLKAQGIISDQNQVVSATTQYSQLPVAPYVQQVCNRYRKSAVKSV